MSVTPVQSLEWFAKARYGLFIHYGLYSLLGRGEWVLNREGIPLEEYGQLADRFKADQFDAEAICDLAVDAGMKYIVLTTMHHEGFRLYPTALSEFSTARIGRDLVGETVAAARKRGLRIGLYHSLNNWKDVPDSVAAVEDKGAYEKFISNTFARLRELVTRYNPIDIVWYDGWWPFDAKGWRAEEMNKMLREIQPHVLFNGRNGLPGDFATPEGHMSPPTPYRPWEACMTLNNVWGYHSGDAEWKTPGQVVDLLATAAAGRGNLLLNVGPEPSGAIPADAAKTLRAVGRWLKACGEAIFETDSFTMNTRERGNHRGDWCHHGPYTVRGNNLYLLARRWPGSAFSINGLENRVLDVQLLTTGAVPVRVAFKQDGRRVTFTGLPAQSPDLVCPVLKITCDSPATLYLTGGLRVPAAPHPRYDPCESELAPGHAPG